MTYSTDQIAELFPNLMDIKCEDLRQKVAAVWNEAITTGCGGKGWTFDELRAVKFTLLAGDIDMTFIAHLNSCVRQCIAIADVLESAFACDIPIDRDILIAGALLADCGKPLEFDKDENGNVIKGTFGEALRHPFSCVAMARIPMKAKRSNEASSRSSSITRTSWTSISRSIWGEELDQREQVSGRLLDRCTWHGHDHAVAVRAGVWMDHHPRRC